MLPDALVGLLICGSCKSHGYSRDINNGYCYSQRNEIISCDKLNNQNAHVLIKNMVMIVERLFEKLEWGFSSIENKIMHSHNNNVQLFRDRVFMMLDKRRKFIAKQCSIESAYIGPEAAGIISMMRYEALSKARRRIVNLKSDWTIEQVELMVASDSETIFQ